MVEFFKTVDGRITEVSEFTEGCWVNMVHPSSDELEQIAQAAQVEEEFVRAALDPEESSRVDTEDEQLLMIVDIPMVEKSSVEDGGQMFTTIPMGIVVAQNAVITVCLEDSIILRSIVALARELGHVHALDGAGDPEALGHRSDELLVLLRVDAPELMVHVKHVQALAGDAGLAAAVLDVELRGGRQQQHGRGVRAAGHHEDDGGEQVLPL